MKNFLLITLFFAVVRLGYCQTANNQLVDVTYINYLNSQYHISIINKQECVAEIEVNWNGSNRDSTVRISGNSVLQVDITAPYINGSLIRVRAKKCGNGGGGNSGWISIEVPNLSSLPIHEPQLARSLPRQARPYEVKIYDIAGNFIKQTTTTSEWKTVAALPPGLYVIRSANAVHKIMRL